MKIDRKYLNLWMKKSFWNFKLSGFSRNLLESRIQCESWFESLIIKLNWFCEKSSKFWTKKRWNFTTKRLRLSWSSNYWINLLRSQIVPLKAVICCCTRSFWFTFSCKIQICSKNKTKAKKRHSTLYNSLFRAFISWTRKSYVNYIDFNENFSTQTSKTQKKTKQKCMNFFLMIYFYVILNNSSFSLPKRFVECQSVRFSFNFNLSSQLPAFTDATFFILVLLCHDHANAKKVWRKKPFYF